MDMTNKEIDRAFFIFMSKLRISRIWYDFRGIYKTYFRYFKKIKRLCHGFKI